MQYHYIKNFNKRSPTSSFSDSNKIFEKLKKSETKKKANRIALGKVSCIFVINISLETLFIIRF